MNALIRNQRKILKYGYDSSNQVVNKYCKYSTIHTYRSSLVLKQLLNGNTPCLSHVAALNIAYDNSRISPPLGVFYASREFHVSGRRYETPSSKVEETVQTMKEKQKEKIDSEKEQQLKSTSEVSTSPKTAMAAMVPEKKAVVKKTLGARIWEEVLHYYHGFRLLFIDINICRKLLWRVLNGKTLSRRENNLLVRTTSDLFRLIPFSVFIIVPFMELLLPVFIKFFPGMLPSTFQTKQEREDKLKQSLQMKLEMAKFLQKTLDEMSVVHKEHKSEDAKQFAQFFQKIKDPNEYVTSEQIIKFAKSFQDELTLDSLSREQLSALCRLLEINTMGTSTLLRFQLRMKLRWLAADDRDIHREGVGSLDLYELQNACKARGMRAYGLTEERLRYQLQEWIDLSLNEKVPQTLLLLSRAMCVSDDTSTADQLKETLRVLPDTVAAKAKAAIGEREGKIDNKTKIEIIKEEERKIKEEREEQRQEEKAKAELLVDKAPSIDVQKPQTLVDPVAATFAAAVPASETLRTEAEKAAQAAKAIEEKGVSSKDVELISKALKTLASEKKQMAVEKEAIKDIKEELEDYQEDVKELQEVRTMLQEDVQESSAAKLLFKKVNKMINQLDTVLADLEKKHQEIAQLTPEQEARKRKEEELVRIDELMNIIRKVKETSDQTRLKQIENVLSKLDADKDGVITMNEVLKVVESISRENVEVDERQVEELIALIDKENLIQAEEKIEKAFQKTLKEAKLLQDKEVKKLEMEGVLEDKAPELKDKAKDLSGEIPMNTQILKAQEEQTQPANDVETKLKAAEKQKEKILPSSDIVDDITSSMPPTLPTPPPTATTTKEASKNKML